MAATKRNVNWYGVGFTPSGGSLASWTGVTNVDLDNQGNILAFSGDLDRLPTTLVNDFMDPMVTVTMADIAKALAAVPGTRGAWTGTLKDAKNQSASSGAGDITFTMANCMVQNNPVGGAHRQFAQGRVILRAESTDGLTNPLTFVVA